MTTRGDGAPGARDEEQPRQSEIKIAFKFISETDRTFVSHRIVIGRPRENARENRAKFWGKWWTASSPTLMAGRPKLC